MTVPTEMPGSVGPVWTAAAVARRLGLAPGTLRSWSQRYGIGPAAHTPGRHRRYTAVDLAELESIHSLVTHGMTLQAAAAIVRHQRGTGPAPRDPDPATLDASTPPDPVAELVAAAARLDQATATAIVTRGLAELGVVGAWEQLCRPALVGLDPAVVDDRGCADSQLLLSGVLTTTLRGIPSAPGQRPVLLACTVREQHALGLEALHAALAERRIPARILGATVPAAALRHAAATLRPRAVVVWAQRAATATPAVFARLAEQTDAVLAAGPGWVDTDLPATVTRAGNLPAALALTCTEAVPEPH